jgi:hypothetical protein
MRVLALIALLLATPAFAQGSEPPGCDKFKWPIDKERALLASAMPVANGATASQQAARIKLAADTAKLPQPPTRQPKAGTYSGFLNVPAPKAGIYRVTLSAGGWIDVFQNGKEVKSSAFTGAPGCDGIRKSVKFDLAAAPYVIEITGVETDSVSVAITAD